MSDKAFGIITSAGSNIHVEGLHDYRPIAAFSFLGRYRVIDFPISNMSNSDIDRIQVYVNARPRSIAEHIGTGRHYNINSKRGKIQLLFTQQETSEIYNNDINSFYQNLEIIQRTKQPYVVIAPSYMVYKQDFDALINDHIESGYDITMLYHHTETANAHYANCLAINFDKKKNVTGLERNLQNVKSRNIFMDTYVMSTKLFIELIKSAKNASNAYSLANIVNERCDDLRVRAVAHKGFFASITSLRDYYEANMYMLDIDLANSLFRSDWPIYTRTTDACPTRYFDTAKGTNSMVSNGCLIEGTVENSIIGREVIVKKGAVVRNSVILAYSVIDEDVVVENQVVDKWAKIMHVKKVTSELPVPGYIRRNDKL